MKPIEGMILAIGDWLNFRVQPLLERTGDASKVTTAFSKYSSRILPVSGETLDVSLGKILKYFSDLKIVAFSGLYRDLSYRAIRLRARYSNYSASADYTTEILYGESAGDLERMWLVIGTGGSESAAGVSGATDFARAYLIVPKIEAESVSDYKGRTFILLQLGSYGSTARYTLTATAATGSHDEKITLKIPKGSHAHVALYELPCSSSYVG